MVVVKEGVEEREKTCPDAQPVLADGPDSGLWIVCFSHFGKGSTTSSMLTQMMLFPHNHGHGFLTKVHRIDTFS